MKITREWLEANGSPCGIQPGGTRGYAWTKAQLLGLGVPYPLTRGWFTSLIGREITDDEAKRFIENKNVVSKHTLKTRAKRQRIIGQFGL